MTNKEVFKMTLIEKYKIEICTYCTKQGKCNIRIHDDCVKCSGYIKDKSKIKTRKKSVACWQRW